MPSEAQEAANRIKAVLRRKAENTRMRSALIELSKRASNERSHVQKVDVEFLCGVGLSRLFTPEELGAQPEGLTSSGPHIYGRSPLKPFFGAIKAHDDAVCEAFLQRRFTNRKAVLGTKPNLTGGQCW